MSSQIAVSKLDDVRKSLVAARYGKKSTENYKNWNYSHKKLL